MNPSTIILLSACLTAAAAVYLLSASLRLNLGPAPARALADYLGEREEGKGAAPQAVERERVILASLGLPHREGLLTALKVGAGGLVAMLVHAGLEGRWRAFRVGLEGELPTFVSRLASTLLVTGSPLLALEEVTATLADDSPLRAWMERLVAGVRTGGQRHMESARAEAAQISPSLALVIFQLGRFFETGGGGFTRAFATTADELSAILEARAIAGAKAESARSAVHMMLAIMGVILLMLLSSPVQRAGFAHPTAQLVTAASLTAMAVGYMVLNGMIEEALD